MHRLRIVWMTLSIAAVAALSGTAMADVHGSDLNTPVRPFALADLSGRTMAGLNFQLTKWTERPLPGAAPLDQTNLSFDVIGEIALTPHILALLSLPILDHTSDTNPVSGDCCELALGNLTAGVRALTSRRRGETRSVFGGTVTVSLPTANDSHQRGGSAAEAALAHESQDPGLYAPNTTTVRFEGAAQFYSRWWFVEPVLGVHFFIYDDDVLNDDSDAAVRLGVAGGVRATEQFAILAELNNMFWLDGDADNGAQRTADTWVGTIDLGVRYATQAFLLGGRVYLPLDQNLRDLDMVGFGLDAGGRF